MPDPRTPVSSEEALERVRSVLGDRISNAKVNFGSVDVTCSAKNLVDVMTTLRDAPELRCNFFTFLSAIDWSEFGEEKGGDQPFEVLIHVYSPDNVMHVNVHVPVALHDGVCPSISSVYGGALWAERETSEMFGVDFEGHPNLVNLYLPEDFEGYPLRKEFRLPTRFVKDWPGAKDPEEAAAGGR